MQDVTRRLARYVVEAKSQDIPDAVRHESKRALLNWLGCAIGGCGHPTVDRALRAFAPFSGPPEATIVGRGERVDILHAALLNGIGSHVLDFDDTHHPTLIHPSGPVMSAALALSERHEVTGDEFLQAAILGIEVECRIGRAVFPVHYDRGWHITGTAGVFGAAAAAGRLLGLDELQMRWALGLAGTQASGLREMFGTMCKSFHPGRAAQNGLASAILAKNGFTSSDRVLEAPRGFAHVLSSDPDLSVIVSGLGDEYELSRNTYKPFACGLVIHPAIDGCIGVREEHRVRADDITGIHVKVNPRVLELTGKRSPEVGLEGKFSIYHSAAVAIIDGAAGEAQYSDERVRDPSVRALRDRVTVEEVFDLSETEAIVSVRTKDGRLLERKVAAATGSLQRPMTDAQLESKVRQLALDLPSDKVERLIELCWSADTLAHASDLARTTVPDRAS